MPVYRFFYHLQLPPPPPSPTAKSDLARDWLIFRETSLNWLTFEEKDPAKSSLRQYVGHLCFLKLNGKFSRFMSSQSLESYILAKIVKNLKSA